jgi:hypothetical protein
MNKTKIYQATIDCWKYIRNNPFASHEEIGKSIGYNGDVRALIQKLRRNGYVKLESIERIAGRFNGTKKICIKNPETGEIVD